MTYRFRLTTHSPRPGLFCIDDKFAQVQLPDGHILTVFPRDSETLRDATKYHFESKGYATEDMALSAGNRFRTQLRILVCALDLALVVPVEDTTGATITEEYRREIEGDRGIHVLDSRVGLWTIPDDETYFEIVVNGRANTYPLEPFYVLDAIKCTWDQDIQLDEKSQRALEIVSLSVSNESPKVRFLTTYLALEQLIPKGHRREEARLLVAELCERIDQSVLSETEKAGLAGALGKPDELTFSATFREFASRITAPTEIDGFPISELAQRSIRLRNSIAHKLRPKDEAEIPKLEKALRKFVIQLIWTNNKLENFSVKQSGHGVAMPELTMRLL